MNFTSAGSLFFLEANNVPNFLSVPVGIIDNEIFFSEKNSQKIEILIKCLHATEHRSILVFCCRFVYYRSESNFENLKRGVIVFPISKAEELGVNLIR